MPLHPFEAGDLEPLHHGLGHVPSIDENQRRGVRFDQFLDPVDVVL